MEYQLPKELQERIDKLNGDKIPFKSKEYFDLMYYLMGYHIWGKREEDK